ncbi:MAG TPA: HAD family phosphatase [Gaiellaceae bacterium]|nr:HAD family phosphatase [Gaiellaceae bacterium]
MRAVVFDFNGTVSDDEPLLARIYQEMFAARGRPMTTDEYYEHLAGHTEEEMFIRWLGHCEQALIDERIRRYNVLAASGSTVDEESRTAIRLAAAQLPVALVSAASRIEIDPVLAAAGVADAFTVIVSQDDVTRGKPDPESYLLAASRLGLAADELLVFEDTDVGVSAAKAAGSYVVGLTRTLGAARMAEADEVVERIDVATIERLLEQCLS